MIRTSQLTILATQPEAAAVVELLRGIEIEHLGIDIECEDRKRKATEALMRLQSVAREGTP